MPNFKKEHSFEKRLAEATKIQEKFPGRIPVIVERAEKSSLPDIDRHKFLVPGDITVGGFLHVIRKRIKLGPEQAIFVFVNNNLLPSNLLMSQVYAENKDEDKFMYAVYQGESAFGA